MSNLFLNTKSLLERVNEAHCQCIEDSQRYKEMGITVLSDMTLGKSLAYQSVIAELEQIVLKHILSNQEPQPKYRPISGEL